MEHPPEADPAKPADESNAEELLRESAPDALKSVSEHERERLRQIKVRVSRTFSGPLPPPADLERFNEIIPSGADRIMKMAEAQSAHRIEVEKSIIESQQIQGKRGQVFGFSIGMAGLIAGTISILCGHDIAGASIGGATLIGLVAVFVTGKVSMQRNLTGKKP